MKWLIYRIAVTFYLRDSGVGDSWVWCWDYSGTFDNYFEFAGWKTLFSDASFSVYEELSYWAD